MQPGVTTFSISEADPPETQVLQVLADVDLHHGEHSHSPPWDGLEVYGATPSPALQEALAEFGVDDILPTVDGFRCRRSVEGAA